MKKKLLILLSVLFVVFLIVAVVFFFLMKNSEPEYEEKEDTTINVEHIAEQIEFLKLNSFDEIKEYSNDAQFYIRESSDELFFGLGELYVDDIPIDVIYRLNDDGTIQRFDGYFSVELKKSNTDELSTLILYFNHIVMDIFGIEYLEHSIYDADGSSMDVYSDGVYEKMLQGNAKYTLSVIDANNTYWRVSAVISDEKTVNFEFFRCFDLDTYNDDSPNIDLRADPEFGEE